MARYATAECIYCHIRLPKPEMYSEKIKVEVGRSGMSASFNPSRKKSGRIHSGRNYYRTKEIWYCINCAAEHEEPNKLKTFLSVLGIGLVIGLTGLFVGLIIIALFVV